MGNTNAPITFFFERRRRYEEVVPVSFIAGSSNDAAGRLWPDCDAHIGWLPPFAYVVAHAKAMQMSA